MSKFLENIFKFCNDSSMSDFFLKFYSTLNFEEFSPSDDTLFQFSKGLAGITICNRNFSFCFGTKQVFVV